MKTDAQIRAHVMRRVYAMYWGRQIRKPAPRIAVVAVLAGALLSSVSIINVVSNALNVNGAYGLVLFAVAAFMNTSLIVQAATAGLVAVLGWISFDTVKSAHESMIPAGAEVAPVQ